MKNLRIVCNLTIAFCVVLGVVLNYMGPNTPKGTLLYYTIQSNILLALACVVFSFYDLARKHLPNYMYLIKYIFTVAIAITGIAFNLFLAPQQIEHYGIYSLTKHRSSENSTCMGLLCPLVTLC